MAAVTVLPPYPHFKELDGTPLNNGYVYIGDAGVDPEANPATVYWDDALGVTATQPIRTINGYYSNAGTPADVFVNATNFSITVRDSAGALIFTKLNYDLALPFTTFDFQPQATGAVSRDITGKLSELVSVKDFGAVGDAVTSDNAAFVLAEALTQNYIYLPAGTYVVTGLSLTKTYWGPGQIELDAVLQDRWFDQIQTTIDGVIPIGGVIAWPTSSVPTNYLECDGSTFSAGTYAALNTLLGGNTLPDLRGEFVRGWDNSRGVDSGRAILSTQAGQMPSHTHNVYTHAGDPAGSTANGAGGGDTVNTVTDGVTSATGGTSNSSETRPRNVAFMYVMRAL